MGTLNVDFQGICTWIPAAALSSQGISVPDGVQWRVVLPHTAFGLHYVDASNDSPQAVPPHNASLNLSVPNNTGNTALNAIRATDGPTSGLLPTSATLWGLRGVSITVANATPGQGLSETGMDTLPSLTQQCDPSNPPGRFAPNVVNGPACAAYWDISVGKLTAAQYASPPAAPDIFHVNYSVETQGNPQISVTTFFDQSQATLNFASATPNITVQNIGQDMDTWWDWIIHYLCFETIPPGITPPGMPVLGVSDGQTAGCSNSVWS